MFALRTGSDRKHLPGKFWTRETTESFAADCNAHDSVDGERGPVTYTVEELVQLGPRCRSTAAASRFGKKAAG